MNISMLLIENCVFVITIWLRNRLFSKHKSGVRVRKNTQESSKPNKFSERENCWSLVFGWTSCACEILSSLEKKIVSLQKKSESLQNKIREM